MLHVAIKAREHQSWRMMVRQRGNLKQGWYIRKIPDARRRERPTESGIVEVQDARYMPTCGGRKSEKLKLEIANEVKSVPTCYMSAETYQSSTRRYSARGIARKGIADRVCGGVKEAQQMTQREDARSPYLSASTGMSKC